MEGENIVYSVNGVNSNLLAGILAMCYTKV